MRIMFLLFLTSVSLVACQNNRGTWDGSYDKLPETAKSCATSWVDNFYTVNSTTKSVASEISRPEKILVLKSGTSGKATYEFLGIFKTKGETKIIFNNAAFEKPRVEVVSDKSFDELFEEFVSLVEKGNKVVQGNYSSLSHAPCEFIQFASEKSEVNVAIVGLYQQENLESAVKSFLDYRNDYVQNMSKENLEAVVNPVPTDPELKILKNNIEDNLFFETRNVWN